MKVNPIHWFLSLVLPEGTGAGKKQTYQDWEKEVILRSNAIYTERTQIENQKKGVD